MAADIRALTGVRGVAAVVIVAYHFGDVQLTGGGNVAYFRIPHGYLPVDLFFMLSGYVIALTYRDANADNLFDAFDFTTPALLEPPTLPAVPSSFAPPSCRLRTRARSSARPSSR